MFFMVHVPCLVNEGLFFGLINKQTSLAVQLYSIGCRNNMVVNGSSLLNGKWQQSRRYSAHRNRVEKAEKSVDDEKPQSVDMSHIKVSSVHTPNRRPLLNRIRTSWVNDCDSLSRFWCFWEYEMGLNFPIRSLGLELVNRLDWACTWTGLVYWSGMLALYVHFRRSPRRSTWRPSVTWTSWLETSFCCAIWRKLPSPNESTMETTQRRLIK